MNDITAIFFASIIGGVVAPVATLAAIADVYTAGKSHAIKVDKAEKRGAAAINGRISVARWKAGEL